MGSAAWYLLQVGSCINSLDPQGWEACSSPVLQISELRHGEVK